MDGVRIILHYSNMNRIPTYALYGETGSLRQQDWLHWETIQSRSRLHDYRINPHRHDQFFQLLLVTGGSGAVTLDGDRFELRRDSLAVVPAGTVHGYGFSADIEGIVVTLLERDLQGLGLRRPDAMVITRDCTAIAAALGRLTAEADRPAAAHDIAMRAHLSLLLVTLHRTLDQRGPSQAGASRAQQLSAGFRDLVEQRFRNTRRVADYADAIGISHTHLNRVCQQVLGKSALAVIEQRIALEARRQLLFSTLPIKQIGAELGYEDPAYFSRFVARFFGMAPAALRRKMRNI